MSEFKMLSAEELAALATKPDELKAYITGLQAQAKAAQEAAKVAAGAVKAAEAEARSRQSAENRERLENELNSKVKLPVLHADALAEITTAGGKAVTVVYELSGEQAGHGKFHLAFNAVKVTRAAGTGTDGRSKEGLGLLPGETVKQGYDRVTTDAEKAEDAATITRRNAAYKTRHPEADKAAISHMVGSTNDSVWRARLAKIQKRDAGK